MQINANCMRKLQNYPTFFPSLQNYPTIDKSTPALSAWSNTTTKKSATCVILSSTNFPVSLLFFARADGVDLTDNSAAGVVLTAKSTPGVVLTDKSTPAGVDLSMVG